MTINARLDEIAEEAERHAATYRWAIDKAIEVVLTAEPSKEALEAAVDAYTGYQSPADRGYAQQEEGMRLAHRAMASALLEEIKKG